MLPSMGRCVLQIAFTDRQDVGQIDQSLFVTAIRMDENIARMNLGVNCHTLRKRYPREPLINCSQFFMMDNFVMKRR